VGLILTLCGLRLKCKEQNIIFHILKTCVTDCISERTAAISLLLSEEREYYYVLIICPQIARLQSSLSQTFYLGGTLAIMFKSH
jgi:hypothetical protein